VEPFTSHRLESLEMGTGQPESRNTFGLIESLKRIDKNPMMKQVVPDVGSRFKLSIPAPDMLYGYNRVRASTCPISWYGKQNGGQCPRTTLSFFVIEFKSDSPGGPGSL
jgi:hypothetical protein